MISFKHKALFIRVPKTGGSSIGKATGAIEVQRPHRNILQIRQIVEKARLEGRLPDDVQLSEDWFAEYYKYGFVRNPWSRVVSLFNRKEGLQRPDRMTFQEFVGWINYASDTCIHPTKHKNQLDWFLDDQGKLLVDFIGRFERLAEDWKQVCVRLDIQASLPHLNYNPVNQRHHTEYYTDHTREIIGRKFRVDIEYFDYKFGD